MGLVALDIITALTIGLGGHYTTGDDGQLVYHRSGREPSICLFSRSGFPYCAKSFGAADPMGDYEPAICTLDAVAALKQDAGGAKRAIDARGELLPLVFAEMELCYYTTASRQTGGAEAAQAVRRALVEAWASGTFGDVRGRLAAEYGEFSAEDHLFAGHDAHYAGAADYEAKVYSTVRTDVTEALVAGGSSPVKAALETLRALRDTLRLAVEFKGLSLDSHVDFQLNMHSRFARLVAGPPLFAPSSCWPSSMPVSSACPSVPPRRWRRGTGGGSGSALPASSSPTSSRSTASYGPTSTCLPFPARPTLCLPAWCGGAGHVLSTSTVPRSAVST